MSASTGGGGFLDGIAGAIGTPTAALRLLLSILVGFPLATFYRKRLYGRSPITQHCFFVVSGFLIGFWNYGMDMSHSVYALCLTFLTFKVFGSTWTSVLVTFAYNMIHLLYGYYTTSTDDYDIKWTMPHCVLTLRLIGLAYDLLDGSQPDAKLSVTQRKTALRRQPSLLEMAAYVYFPGSFLIGPQFSMRRYLDHVDGTLVETGLDAEGRKLPPDSVVPGLKRAAVGFVYIALYLFGTQYASDQYLLDPDFEQLSFVRRCFLLGLWGRCNLYKYISCWLITEGVCIAFGLAYNGRDEKTGRDKWDGLANVDLLTFENATEFNHYILSFNINTNHWCAEYMYKRLKFLGSKLYSQLVTLTFLAIWHGTHSGYYLCFFQEFIIMYFEKDMKPVLLKNEKLMNFATGSMLGRIVTWILLKIYTFVFMGYSLIPFVLLSYSRYMKVYTSFYFMGHVIFLSYPLLAPFIKPLVRGGKRRSAEDSQQQRPHTD
ncbi:lysophospholipid acyltransferase 5 [Trichogramma pretiosum]|uniref:lysophospholipid acyltransferase 5 n=1 Tax=Trichogramma pretiosum TaxID=7493 RepID=UPI0006C9BE58|nr:lysophospholipid acyltransferase 5 [Trichogramma pretiosum]